MPVSKEKKEEVLDKEVSPKKETSKKKTPVKKSPPKKMPKFEAKEVLLLEGKECVFVERVRDKILVRLVEGGYASASESEFSVK